MLCKRQEQGGQNHQVSFSANIQSLFKVGHLKKGGRAKKKQVGELS